MIVYTPVMEPGYEWDPEKNEENIRKHGIDFRTAVRIFAGPVLERRDDRFDYGEVRMAAIGVVDGIEMTVYTTDRGKRRRLISARKATRDERQAYYHAIYP